MANRPGYGRQQSQDDLLNLADDNDNPIYNSGQAPPMSDERMLHDYDIETAQPRISTSHDDFVGSSSQPPLSTGGIPGGPGYVVPKINTPGGRPGAPLDGQRNYSQTSGLGNYQRYSDMDNESDAGVGYYAAGGGIDEDNVPGLPIHSKSKHRSRNSILSLGGGITGRVKNALGMGPEYSEMDLPLTEQGIQRAGSGSTIQDSSSQPPPPQKTPGSKFKFGLRGRGEPDPTTLGPRLIHLNNPPANATNKYVNNHVSTAKYNAATILPKFLFEQFSKYANLFFLFTAILQQIPGISPTNKYTTIVPLAIVMMVSLAKEIVEDNRRKSQDRQLNRSPTKVLRGTRFEDVKWIDVGVGDIVRVESEEPFPADLVLLASSEPEGLCYIETANLDGETNLKIKQAIPETCEFVS